MPGGEKSLELLHKAQKVILPLTDIITTFSPLGYILTAKANKQVKEAHPKINDQLSWRRNLLVASQSPTAGELESRTSLRRSPCKNKPHFFKNCPKPWHLQAPYPEGIGIYSATNNNLGNKTSIAKHHISDYDFCISLQCCDCPQLQSTIDYFQTCPVVWNVQDNREN